MPERHTNEFSPEVDGEDVFAVRLLFNVKAENPEHAVDRFIDQINTFGFKTWVYRVLDVERNEAVMVHPDQEVTYTLEEFAELMSGATSDEEVAERLEDVATDGRL